MNWRSRHQPQAGVLPQRFLFLFSDTGGGHRASSQAVKAELERRHGGAVSVEMVDIFVEMDRWPFDRLPDWYPTIVGLNGIPWGVGFHLSDGAHVVRAMSRLAWPYTRTAICRLLKQHPADIIVSFHPVPNYALFLGLQQLGMQTPFAVVAVDLVTAHAGWFAPQADRVFVPTHAAKTRAVQCGMDEGRVKVTGMPVRRCFVRAMHLSQAQARDQLQLRSDRPIVLIVGGGDGMGPLSQVVRAIARQQPPAQIVVITGRNRSLYDELTASDLPSPVQVEGFVSNMEVWMRAADILVTKAGPNTLAEAFLTGLPMVLYTALPGQEEGNVDHVIKNGAGIWAPIPRLAARAVMRLLDATDQRRAMAQRSLALARPQATEQIARELWRLTHLQRAATVDLAAVDDAAANRATHSSDV
jgi:1,2-diacylglycerol 3-beta-galactosyltransferase